MSDTNKIISGLRALAAELEPFTHEVQSGALVWDGNAYVKSNPRKADSYALAWWSTLNSIADVIERQNTPLTQQQIDYLKKKLFGGMGSLRDLGFNEKLDQKLDELYKLF